MCNNRLQAVLKSSFKFGQSLANNRKNRKDGEEFKALKSTSGKDSSANFPQAPKSFHLDCFLRQKHH
jgi:hypothetical protein